MPTGPDVAARDHGPTATRPGQRDEPADAAPGDKPSRWRTALAVISLVGAAVSVGVWVTAALTMADRGLDVTDEGFYLLSYRWWDTSLRNFTGAQYVYGPVFELLGFDIARLRYFRVVTVLAASGFFGWAFARWVAARRGWSSWVWEAAAATAVVGSAGMMFSWLPLSPGYNDLTGLTAMVGLALVLRAATLVERGMVVPGWVFGALGVVCVVMLMGRWSAVVAAAVLISGAVGVGARAHWSGWVAALAWTLGGALLALLPVHVLLVPLDDAVEGLLGPNRLMSDGDHSPQTLLTRYWESSVDIVSAGVARYWPVLAAAALAGLVSKGRSGALTAALAVGALGLTVVRELADEQLLEGQEYRDRFGRVLVALALTVLVTGLGAACSTWWERREWSRPSWRTVVPVALLLVVPLVAGVGTNNLVWLLAVNLFAVTLAFMITVLVHIDGARWGARAVAFSAIAVAVAVSSVIARDALLNHPYRSVSAAAATSVVGDGATPWGSVRVSADAAREYAGLRAALAPHLLDSPTPVLALERMSGVVLLLDARPVGEPWTGPAARARSAAGLLEECRSGRLGRAPVLLFNRPPDETDDRALAACGLDLDTDYRLLKTPVAPPGVTAYVPSG